MNKSLVVALLLSGCAGAVNPKLYPYQCVTHGTLVQAAEPLDCQIVDHNLQAVIDLTQGRFADASDVDATLRSVVITVRNDRLGWDSLNGDYNPNNKEIEVARAMTGLQHEFLHALDDHRGVDWNRNSNHVGWGTNGYLGACATFDSCVVALDTNDYE